MTGLDDLALFIAVEGAYAITWLCLKYRGTQRNADRRTQATKEQK